MSIFAKTVVIGNVRKQAKPKKRTVTAMVSKTCQYRDGKEGDEAHWKACGAKATYRVRPIMGGTYSTCQKHAMAWRRYGARIAPIW